MARLLDHLVGPDSGTTPLREKIRANGCDFYTFRDGLVVKKDSYWKIVEI
jgi:hypothetical protein